MLIVIVCIMSICILMSTSCEYPGEGNPEFKPKIEDWLQIMVR
jgi:hypothetical protein